MRIESIRFVNYRQYRDMVFNFPKNSVNDIHLLIASNGVGKTNLLNGINWCLYGDEPHTSGGPTTSNGDKLSIANIDALHSCEKNGETLCKVEVEIDGCDGDIHYIFSRNANVDTASHNQVGRDTYSVIETLPSGDTKIYESDAADITGKLMPKKIREYFFFDGEQLLNYFETNQSSVSHLRDCIYAIAQVDVIADAELRLSDTEKAYQKIIKANSPDVESYLEKLTKIEDNIKELENEQSRLREEIKKGESEIKKADSIIHGSGSMVEDDKRYRQNLDDIDLLKKQLSARIEDLEKFIRKYVVLLCLFDVNYSNTEYISQRQSDGNNSVYADIETIKNSLKRHSCVLCNNPLSPSVEEHLNDILKKLEHNASLKRLYEIRNDISDSLEIDDFEKEKLALLSEITEEKSHLETKTKENDIIHERMKVVSSSLEGVRQAFNDREYYNRLVQYAHTKEATLDGMLKICHDEKEKAETDYNNAVDKTNIGNSAKRAYEFTHKAKIIIQQIKDEIVGELKTELEKKTMQLFDELIWKQDTYDHVELDSNFTLKLFSKKDLGKSCLESCSAAEKELLALAFTITIHQVSGYDNLLFIDTPVGRVSDTNREHFANVLLNVSRGKQIILAFTPSDYSEEIKSVLTESNVSSIQRLKSDEIVTSKGN